MTPDSKSPDMFFLVSRRIEQRRGTNLSRIIIQITLSLSLSSYLPLPRSYHFCLWNKRRGGDSIRKVDIVIV